MLDGLKRNGVQIGGMVACGGVCVSAAPFLLSGHGSLGPTMLRAESPLTAVIVVAVVLAISAFLAAGVARMINTAVGLFCLGCGLFVLTLRLFSIVWAIVKLYGFSLTRTGDNLRLRAEVVLRRHPALRAHDPSPGW